VLVGCLLCDLKLRRHMRHFKHPERSLEGGPLSNPIWKEWSYVEEVLHHSAKET
jgi:hypothetical protein